MAIKSKKEILRKTDSWVAGSKYDLDSILNNVESNNKGMGYEMAAFILDGLAKTAADLAKSFKQWANDDRQGKLEESKTVTKHFVNIYKKIGGKEKSVKESILQTQNEGWGFFGTMTGEFPHNAMEKAKEACKIAFREVQKATSWSDVEVRVWLDSRDGRHFADQCIDFGATDDPRDGISQAAKFYKERKWFNKI